MVIHKIPQNDKLHKFAEFQNRKKSDDKFQYKTCCQKFYLDEKEPSVSKTNQKPSQKMPQKSPATHQPQHPHNPRFSTVFFPRWNWVPQP